MPAWKNAAARCLNKADSSNFLVFLFCEKKLPVALQLSVNNFPRL